jgi:hypothetical protein
VALQRSSVPVACRAGVQQQQQQQQTAVAQRAEQQPTPRPLPSAETSHHHQQAAADRHAPAAQQQQQVVQQQQVQQQLVQQQRPRLPASLSRAWLRGARLPLRRAVRTTEQRLDAELATVAATIMFVVGLISLDRGIQDLCDNIFGASPLGSVLCMLLGLGLVVGVRIAGGRVGDHFSL